jgi:hypothetical protein
VFEVFSGRSAPTAMRCCRSNPRPLCEFANCRNSVDPRAERMAKFLLGRKLAAAGPQVDEEVGLHRESQEVLRRSWAASMGRIPHTNEGDPVLGLSVRLGRAGVRDPRGTHQPRRPPIHSLRFPPISQTDRGCPCRPGACVEPRLNEREASAEATGTRRSMRSWTAWQLPSTSVSGC